MERKRFIIEIGTGIDLHGEDVTEAACRAVKDAISSNCLCGLAEVLTPDDVSRIEVEIVIASPKPDEVDLAQVEAVVPIGDKKVTSVPGGMTVKGLLVPRFGPDKDQIVVANAAVTVFVCS
ncbi:MAG: Lin0512 family protein [Desulfobacterales bacterium]